MNDHITTITKQRDQQDKKIHANHNVRQALQKQKNKYEEQIAKMRSEIELLTRQNMKLSLRKGPDLQDNTFQSRNDNSIVDVTIKN